MANRIFDARIDLDAPQLHAARDRVARAHLQAGKDGLADTVREGEQALEAGTRRVAKGNLWRAWASDLRPKGRRIAREPVGIIFLKGGARTRGAIAFFTQRGRVQSRTEGGYLAIPLPAAGSRGKGRNLTPGEWERREGVRLRYVYRGRGKPALLVADVGTTNARGAFRPITRRRTLADERRGFVRGEQTVPIFVLIAPYDFQGGFDIDEVTGRLEAKLAGNVRQRVAAIPD